MKPTSSHDALHPADAERRLDAPFISFGVPFEIARLRAEPEYQAEGHTGRTLAKYDDLRVVLEAMKKDTRLTMHDKAERMTLQVILGQVRVWIDYSNSYEVAEGGFASIDARIHAIEALEECAFLLTVAWPRPGGAA
jgi:quercetin dioxygenase-like cupin family protein